MATLFVNGSAGSIGSCYVLDRCAVGNMVINLGKLIYFGNPRHIFVHDGIVTQSL